MTQTYIHVNHLTEVTLQQPTYLAIGSFDGVHRGHQAILSQVVAAARQDGTRAAVLTFFPHPARLIQGITGRYYLNTVQDRVQLLADLGIDLIITQPFDDELRQMRAADFVEQLITYLDMRQIWGGSFAFGYQREGDIPFLQELGKRRGFTVHVADGMTFWNGRLVSSSRIREGINQGNMDDVNGCLARPYTLSGIVSKGDQRGRTIGFPTANLAVWEELLLPGNGVYATYAWLDGKRHRAATNVGVRPTVNGRDRTVETHLLDFSAEIYDQTLHLEFIKRIRPEIKFATLDALKAQIHTDVEQIRQLLA